MTCAASAAYTPGSAGRGGTVSGTTGTGSAGSSSLPPGSSGGGGASVVVVVLVVVVGLVVGAGSRVAGVDVYSPEAFYIPWLYAMSDQMGANVAGFLHLWRKQGAATRAVARYLRQDRKSVV